MISVASKGFMLSHSIDRRTFLFNFLCFVADVFGTFSVITWLFYTIPNKPQVTILFLPSIAVNMATAIWLWKEFIMCISLVLIGFAAWLYHLYGMVRLSLHRNHEGFFILFFGPVLGVIVYIPLLILIEVLKFAIIPLAVMDTLASKSTKTGKFSRLIIDFYDKGDYCRKLFIVNKLYLQNAKPDDMNKMAAIQEKDFTVDWLRNHNRTTWRHRVCESKVIFKELKRAKCEIKDIGFVFFTLVAMPGYVLNIIYSIIYPVIVFIMFLNHQHSDISAGLFQFVLTIIYISVLAIMGLVLLPRVLTVMNYYHDTPFFKVKSKGRDDIKNIEEIYDNFIYRDAKKWYWEKINPSQKRVFPKELVDLIFSYVTSENDKNFEFIIPRPKEHPRLSVVKIPIGEAK